MFSNKVITYSKQINVFVTHFATLASRRYPYASAFINLYQNTIGQEMSDGFISELTKKHPNILNLSEDIIQCTLQILSKFSISPEQACHYPHVFCMNPISMDNYGEILRECGFTNILPNFIIRYNTLVKSKTIAQLKKDGLIRDEINLEEHLNQFFHDWPHEKVSAKNFQDSSTNIVTVRMSVLEEYLQFKLSITSDEFKRYCKNYLPLRHRPMCDIQEALNIAQNNIKLNMNTIRRNGFTISCDPVNTKLILDNVDELGGLDIRNAIRTEPAILKNNYRSLLEIRSLLEEYNISNEAQRNCLKIYCMRPQTVKERLEQLSNMKEYQFLSTNVRVSIQLYENINMSHQHHLPETKVDMMLSMVVHERKMVNRLAKLQAASKQCYSLNHLISSNKVFNTYINSFGDKTSSRDLGALISSSLHGKNINKTSVLNKLRRHKYWLHTALHIVLENLQRLKKDFQDEVIFNNCQILLYPVAELEQYIKFLVAKREGASNIIEKSIILDASYSNLDFRQLTDKQLLSLVLYEIEKRYHFSGDGIWTRNDGNKIDSQEKKL